MKINIAEFIEISHDRCTNTWGPLITTYADMKRDKSDNEFVIEGSRMDKIVVLDLSLWYDCNIKINVECLGLIIAGHSRLNNLDIHISHPERVRIDFISGSCNQLKLVIESPATTINTRRQRFKEIAELKMGSYKNVRFDGDAIESFHFNEPRNLAKFLFTEEELKRIENYKV